MLTSCNSELKHKYDCQDKVGDKLKFYIRVSNVTLFIMGEVVSADNDSVTLYVGSDRYRDLRQYYYDEMIPEDAFYYDS